MHADLTALIPTGGTRVRELLHPEVVAMRCAADGIVVEWMRRRGRTLGERDDDTKVTQSSCGHRG